ncbi:DUF3168 domain-containing protein [Variovorax ginsengisoli]|uniref:DUF3168 domain-containing protein n=1 Tax=Variovorax ginsengisoli TaxID=363844 RepID=A0ABT8SDP5_9BURK|nr:DUF3168 domain-containing protein [Variovorax ginsengisoli]MDN8617872.1 DUF3168 domain-containing protein [Variovorax ginsengisoli]MDO1537042.1 DUF3168 domain-containing protein [Variovorax ginsengisoli]
MSLLEPLVAGAVYPVSAPDDVAKPYLTVTQVGGRTVAYLERALVSKKHGRFQINWWARSKGEVVALAAQIESAILLSPLFQAEALDAPNDIDGSLVDLFGMQQDFGIWSDR